MLINYILSDVTLVFFYLSIQGSVRASNKRASSFNQFLPFITILTKGNW